MIGVDIVHVPRIKKALDSPSFTQRVFTQAERDYCAARPQPELSYAGLFCAKEAIIKALGTGFGRGIMPSDIQISHNGLGAPVFENINNVSELNKTIEVSISHDGDYAVAVAVVTNGRY